MRIDELLMLTDDQIEYHNLPDDILKELALSNELFIAASALTELSIRQSPGAASVAGEILAKSHGDHHLHSTALEVLFKMNRRQAMDFMSQQAPHCDPDLLNMISEFITENEPEFKSGPALTIAHLVTERLRGLDGVKTPLKKIYPLAVGVRTEVPA